MYSAAVPLDQYQNGDHVWDSHEAVKRLRLEKLRGFLFDSTAALVQEFESNFDVRSGRFINGWNKRADGTYQKL